MNIWEYLLLGAIFSVLISFTVMTFGIIFGAGWGAPFIPTRKRTVEKMIEIAQIQPGEIIFDLGCGDGRFVFAAAKAGAKKAIGIEVSPLVYLYAKVRNLFIGTKKSEIRFGNFFHHRDVRNADVIFVFLLPKIMSKVFSDIWPHLKPGSRVISNSFTPKDVAPDKIIPKESGTGKVLVFVKK